MTFRAPTRAVLLVVLALAGPTAADDAVPPVYAAHISEVPDLLQTDPALGLKAGGDQYCGPVAVSNSLLWLATQDRAELVPGLDARSLIAKLADRRFMDTDPRKGTGPGELMKGLSAYLAERGFPDHRLEYQGWRRMPSRFHPRREIPRLGDLQRTLAEGGAVWLHVGWYVQENGSHDYSRVHGHWLTLVGYGVDRHGVENDHIVIVHDPSPRAGREPSNQFVELERLDSGTLKGRYRGLPRAAHGYQRLGGELRLPKGRDAAILDGAVLLALDPRPAGRD